MILVMLGTNPYSFNRLLDKVIEWAENNDDHVIVQSGNTPVNNKAIEAYAFIEHSRILELIAEADVVITQGGFGSLQDCIRLGGKTVAVPRLIEFGESIDDQREIVDALAEEGLVVSLYDVDKLDGAIKFAQNMKIKAKNNCKLPEHISATIKNILGKL